MLPGGEGPIFERRHENREFVATEAGDERPGWRHPSQPGSEDGERLVTLLVADTVVDQREMIEGQENEPTVGLRLKHIVEDVTETPTVGEVGQRVVESNVFALVDLTPEVIDEGAIGEPGSEAVGDRLDERIGLGVEGRPDLRFGEDQPSHPVATCLKRGTSNDRMLARPEQLHPHGTKRLHIKVRSRVKALWELEVDQLIVAPAISR